MHWDGYWHMGWMWIWWLLILAAFAAAVWFGVAAARRGVGPWHETPEQVVKRRYARGEIDRATYERMLEDLRR